MSIDKLRLDKWLWAARFFKTRSMAADAVNGGKVHLNGDRVKAARAVKVGDVLKIRRQNELWTVNVLELFEKRRAAPDARKMYEETFESQEQRELLSEQRRAANRMIVSHRPSKKERRDLMKLKRNNQQDF